MRHWGNTMVDVWKDETTRGESIRNALKVLGTEEAEMPVDDEGADGEAGVEGATNGLAQLSDAVRMGLERFICNLYACHSKDELNVARIELLQRNPGRDAVTIPCTTHCFRLHGLRCQLQCKLWCMVYQCYPWPGVTCTYGDIHQCPQVTRHQSDQHSSATPCCVLDSVYWSNRDITSMHMGCQSPL